jgi:enediyne biosynthesis protein E4
MHKPSRVHPWLAFILLTLTVTAQDVSLQLDRTQLTSEQVCSSTFVRHELDHVTAVPGGDKVRAFEANGGGVAINDLDKDGDLDIVLANHAGMNSILWNEGALTFRKEAMTIGDSRAATIIDVDGDGWLDIVFSRRASAPNYFRNQGNRTFALETLPNVSKPLYAITWADFDKDGDLDLVGGTYDAGLLNDFGQDFLASGQGGVFYYEQRDGKFLEQRLASNAQALAIAVVDLNGDNREDLLIGNDFAVPDMAWYNTEQGWQEATPFTVMSHSTMSFDVGDINNDSRAEVFSTDMKPYPNEDEAAWLPMMEMMAEPAEGDPQVMENVLQVPQQSQFTNEASARGIDGTGWSWSAKFGDLDQDGFLDLYVVNGMMEATTFAHLPNHELVEENQVFRNDGRGMFQAVPSWGLSSRSSGRGMSMADLDNDGDLDIVVNNLRSPSQLFENQLCEGSSLQLELAWTESDNTKALGAVVELYTDQATYRRDVRAVSGYLSGDTARLHFGFPENTALQKLVIYWPDGGVSTIPSLQANTFLLVRRD